MVDIWRSLLWVLLLLWVVCLAPVSFFQLLMLAMAVLSCSLIEVVAALRVSEVRVVEVSCKTGLEAEYSVSSRCFSSSSSSHCTAAYLYRLRDR